MGSDHLFVSQPSKSRCGVKELLPPGVRLLRYELSFISGATSLPPLRRPLRSEVTNVRAVMGGCEEKGGRLKNGRRGGWLKDFSFPERHQLHFVTTESTFTLFKFRLFSSPPAAWGKWRRHGDTAMTGLADSLEGGGPSPLPLCPPRQPEGGSRLSPPSNESCDQPSSFCALSSIPSASTASRQCGRWWREMGETRAARIGVEFAGESE